MIRLFCFNLILLWKYSINIFTVDDTGKFNYVILNKNTNTIISNFNPKSVFISFQFFLNF